MVQLRPSFFSDLTEKAEVFRMEVHPDDSASIGQKMYHLRLRINIDAIEMCMMNCDKLVLFGFIDQIFTHCTMYFRVLQRECPHSDPRMTLKTCMDWCTSDFQEHYGVICF